MKQSPAQSVLRRFTGKRGKNNLLSALLRQSVVGGDVSLAEGLAGITELQEIGANQIILNQGHSDNDLYLVISGKVVIKINGREVATRNEGSHFGEMALIDPTARRSATVATIEPTIIAKITEANFSRLANEYPQLWRRIAVELANRLRERSRFLRPPHNQPEVFIGSSSEGLAVARAIDRYLKRHPIVSRLWITDVFQPSNTAIEDLTKMAEDADFAVIVLTPDDVTRSRGHALHSPRDNAVFELGLFMGAISRSRTFLVKPRGIDIKIPSDLLGVTCLQYTHPQGRGHRLRVNLMVTQLERYISQLGPR